MVYCKYVYGNLDLFNLFHLINRALVNIAKSNIPIIQPTMYVSMTLLYLNIGCVNTECPCIFMTFFLNTVETNCWTEFQNVATETGTLYNI